MKQVSFFQVAFFAVLMVLGIGCGVPMGMSGYSYEEVPARANAYQGDQSYRGTNTIIVERDPFTGRYYQVSPGSYYGGIYGAPAYPYNQPRYYGRGTNRGSGYYRKDLQGRPQPPSQRREQMRQDRETAKESILGKRRN